MSSWCAAAASSRSHVDLPACSDADVALMACPNTSPATEHAKKSPVSLLGQMRSHLVQFLRIPSKNKTKIAVTSLNAASINSICIIKQQICQHPKKCCYACRYINSKYCQHGAGLGTNYSPGSLDDSFQCSKPRARINPSTSVAATCCSKALCTCKFTENLSYTNNHK